MTTSHSASDTATSKPRRSVRARAAATASRGDTGSHPATTRPRRRRQRSATPVLQVTGTCPVVAFGDVHGSASLLEQELERDDDSGAELIFLGGLIDRSPEPDGDRRVLERIWALQRQPELWGLAGVTFQSLLAALFQNNADAAVAEPRKLHHAPHLRQIGLRNPEKTNSVGISHAAGSPPGRPGW